MQQLAAGGELRGSGALCCLANAVQLLACPSGTSPQDGCSSRCVYLLAPSPALADARTAAAFAAAVMPLLTAAAAGGGDEAGVVQQLWPLASQAHLLQMMAVLAGSGSSSGGSSGSSSRSPDGQGMVLFAGYCVHLVQVRAGGVWVGRGAEGQWQGYGCVPAGVAHFAAPVR